MAKSKAELLSNNFLKTAENTVTHIDEKDERDEKLEILKNIVSKICMHGEKMKKVATVMNELRNTIDDSNDAKEMQKLKTERVKELYNYEPDVSEHPIFKDYCQQTKEIVDTLDGTGHTPLGDDDIEMTQDAVINVQDPFSKKRMTDPVKNKVCGHVYDRDTVAAVLEKNKNTRCPLMGCTSKDYISMGNLVTDIKTRKYLHDNPA